MKTIGKTTRQIRVGRKLPWLTAKKTTKADEKTSIATKPTDIVKEECRDAHDEDYNPTSEQDRETNPLKSTYTTSLKVVKDGHSMGNSSRDDRDSVDGHSVATGRTTVSGTSRRSRRSTKRERRTDEDLSHATSSRLTKNHSRFSVTRDDMSTTYSASTGDTSFQSLEQDDDDSTQESTAYESTIELLRALMGDFEDDDSYPSIDESSSESESESDSVDDAASLESESRVSYASEESIRRTIVRPKVSLSEDDLSRSSDEETDTEDNTRSHGIKSVAPSDAVSTVENKQSLEIHLQDSDHDASSSISQTNRTVNDKQSDGTGSTHVHAIKSKPDYNKSTEREFSAGKTSRDNDQGNRSTFDSSPARIVSGEKEIETIDHGLNKVDSSNEVQGMSTNRKSMDLVPTIQAIRSGGNLDQDADAVAVPPDDVVELSLLDYMEMIQFQPDASDKLDPKSSTLHLSDREGLADDLDFHKRNEATQSTNDCRTIDSTPRVPKMNIDREKIGFYGWRKVFGGLQGDKSTWRKITKHAPRFNNRNIISDHQDVSMSCDVLNASAKTYVETCSSEEHKKVITQKAIDTESTETEQLYKSEDMQLLRRLGEIQRTPHVPRTKSDQDVNKNGSTSKLPGPNQNGKKRTTNQSIKSIADIDPEVILVRERIGSLTSKERTSEAAIFWLPQAISKDESTQSRNAFLSAQEESLASLQSHPTQNDKEIPSVHEHETSSEQILSSKIQKNEFLTLPSEQLGDATEMSTTGISSQVLAVDSRDEISPEFVSQDGKEEREAKGEKRVEIPAEDESIVRDIVQPTSARLQNEDSTDNNTCFSSIFCHLFSWDETSRPYCEHCHKPFFFTESKVDDFVGDPRCGVKAEFHQSCKSARDEIKKKKMKVVRQVALFGHLKRKHLRREKMLKKLRALEETKKVHRRNKAGVASSSKSAQKKNRFLNRMLSRGSNNRDTGTLTSGTPSNVESAMARESVGEESQSRFLTRVARQGRVELSRIGRSLSPTRKRLVSQEQDRSGSMSSGCVKTGDRNQIRGRSQRQTSSPKRTWRQLSPIRGVPSQKSSTMAPSGGQLSHSLRRKVQFVGIAASLSRSSSRSQSQSDQPVKPRKGKRSKKSGRKGGKVQRRTRSLVSINEEEGELEEYAIVQIHGLV